MSDASVMQSREERTVVVIRSIAKLPEGRSPGTSSVSTLRAWRLLRDRVNNWRLSILEFHHTASQMDLSQPWVAGVIKYRLFKSITRDLFGTSHDLFDWSITQLILKK